MNKNMIFRVGLLGLFLAACSAPNPDQSSSSEKAAMTQSDSAGCKSVVSRKDIAR